MKTNESDSRYPQQFCSPADFPLGSPESRAAARFNADQAERGKSAASRLIANLRKEQMACNYRGPAFQAFMAYLEGLRAQAEDAGHEEHVSEKQFISEMVRKYGVEGAMLAEDK